MLVMHSLHHQRFQSHITSSSLKAAAGVLYRSLTSTMGKVAIDDGIQKEILKEGSGPVPTAGQTITVHCTGSLEGPPVKKFWSTKDKNQPFQFQVGLNKVIEGWDKGCLTMKAGEEAILTIRGDKGYGANGFPAWGITPNATLLFQIEILSIQ